MYNLMIVDDEANTVNGLKKHINWAAYDINIIATASSGKEALEKIYKYKPHIVISDIKMPELTGLEVAKIVMQDMPDTKFLFISGYDDMEFINSAFAVNATNYILKPINLTALEECINQIVEKLKSEDKQKENTLKIETQMFYSIPLLQDNFFNKLLCGEMYSKDINEQLELLNLDFDPQKSFFAIIAEIDDYKKTIALQSEISKDNSNFAILNVSKELLSEVCKVYVMRNTFDKAIFIVQAEKHEIFYPVLQDIQKKLMEILSISLTIGVGERVIGMENLSKSYVSAMNAIGKKIILGKKQIIVEKNPQSNSPTDPDSYVLIDANTLLEALKETDKVKIEKAIKDIFEQLVSTTHLPKFNQIHYINHQLMLSATNFSIDHMCFSEEIQKLKDNSLDLLEKTETIDECRELITGYYFKICDTYTKKKNDKVKMIFFRRKR